jgi:hypothetical protein
VTDETQVFYIVRRERDKRYVRNRHGDSPSGPVNLDEAKSTHGCATNELARQITALTGEKHIVIVLTEAGGVWTDTGPEQKIKQKELSFDEDL